MSSAIQEDNSQIIILGEYPVWQESWAIQIRQYSQSRAKQATLNQLLCMQAPQQNLAMERVRSQRGPITELPAYQA